MLLKDSNTGEEKKPRGRGRPPKRKPAEIKGKETNKKLTLY